MQIDNILDNLNMIAEKLFRTVEGQVYIALDKINVIKVDIFNEAPLVDLVNINKINGIIVIANSLILLYVLYYIVSRIICVYNGNLKESIYIFIIKLVMVIVLVNSSYFICLKIVEIFEVFTQAIDIFGSNICKIDLNFSNLKESIISVEKFMTKDLISIDGLIKGVISYGMVTILINFSIRYVTIIFLIIISPFAIISLCNKSTSAIFNTWIKLLIINLAIQIVIKFILIIPLMYKNTDDIIYKIILVGSIYIIYSINTFTKELLSKFRGG